MYGPVNINALDLASEVERVQRKLATGLESLRSVGDTAYGATGKQAVYRDGRLTLYRFQGEHGSQTPSRSNAGSRPPILIVYALVNRPYMVDLQHDRSLVRNLLARGEDVYIIDWGYPDPSDRYLDLEDYLLRFIDGCVDHVRSAHGLDAVNLLGICQGGAFSLSYAALRPDKVGNLITMVTPVDFHTPDNMLSHWVRELDIDLFVDTLGNVPADLMNWCYLTLKPYRLFVQKYVGLVDILDDVPELENFLRMERWIFDSPDQAGEAFRQFIKDYYQRNGLVNGGIVIGGEPVDLGRVTMPVLNIFAEADHLVPPDASRALRRLAGTRDYTELCFKGGHIGIYVSGRAQREVPQAIHDWLNRRR